VPAEPQTRVVTGYRDEIGDRGDQRPRLAVHAEAVAQVAGVLQSDPRPPAVDAHLPTGSIRGHDEMLAELAHPLPSQHPGQVCHAPTGRRDHQAGKLLAQPFGHLTAYGRLAVVRVQRTPATLVGRRGQTRQQPTRGATDPGAHAASHGRQVLAGAHPHPTHR
jgi:hypothetical protein